MARRRQPDVVGDEHDIIVRWYKDRLHQPAPPPSTHKWPPVLIGPTWQRTDDGHWVLPEHSIGWDVLGWCGTWLQHTDGQAWRFTDEQARFLLWWYAVDDDGRFLFRDGVLQRLKGWGKDPIGACICANEMLGPARFLEWDGDQPVATDVADAWVQTAAVSLEQTKNTMRLFPSLFTPAAIGRFRIQIGKTVVHAMRDQRLIEAVTSSPATLEGARASFVLRNEPHHWLANNEGHEMAAVIERNATKSVGGGARALSITNAYEPGEDSVAERDREAWEQIQAGVAADVGMLYDSIEAPPDAPLSEEEAPFVVEGIRGDSHWLDIERILQSILDVRNPPSRSRRFWYNQITASEDAWLSPQEYDRAVDHDKVVAPKSQITLGFDGSITDDHSALIGCSIDLDHLFEVDVWEPDPATGEIDRAAVDLAVRQAFETYDVVGFYSDVHPWESYVDRWAEELGADLCVKASPRQAIGWDLRGRLQQFTHATERLHDAIVERNVTHDGAAKMRRHFHNARRRPNRFGIGVGKEHRESARKIDAVPAAVLARLARLDYLALPESRRRRVRRSGVVMGIR